jgi:imidazolonepropionase-like amidohydrolase
MESVKIPPETTVIDTSGQTMLPGLIDAHIHLVLVGHGDYPRYFKWLDGALGRERRGQTFGT